MKPFELRLAQEHAQAVRHLRNLRNFTADPSRFSRIDGHQRALLLEQADVLARYVEILEKRMYLLNIPV